MTARLRDLRLRMLALMIAIPTAVGSVAVLMMWYPTSAYAQSAPVGLGTAANFAVLAGSTVTNTGDTVVGQDLGVHPGTAVTGFPPGEVLGEIHEADAVAQQAKTDLTTAYNDAAGRTPFTALDVELGGETLGPGVYRITAAQLTGQLTLDLQEDPDAVFIFQIDSTLITASNSSVIFINGASPCNVYWKVGSSATLGTGTDFLGNIMASESVTMNTGATLEGRALAQTGAVTLDTNTITEPECAPDAPPTSDGPTSDGPTTDGPTTDGPTTDGPTTDGPTTDGPTTDGPTTDGPTTDGPTTDGPTTDGPTTDGPSTDGPTTDRPTGDDSTSNGPTLKAKTSSDDFMSWVGLPITGSGAWVTILTAGLALIAAGGLLAFLAWRRARQS
ncbi:ice-binding family protein [Glycomyces harbinensis]|uniref:Type VI secretion system secreted protein VgrG n=1 Tax=Glycomyces harbinensis TaxID=58114 RepID=A0A1G6TQ52_9ACTN|nr:ice-binding family protein [Glycomyces harbinensis]SDD31312.1 type VI secretion system secreted protein VgrG [Glycomyces harbinensis]